MDNCVKMDEESSANPNKRRGRKRKKNFLMNAKKYAKKGQMGRGTKISEELYQYFVGILESMKRGIESQEERQALVDNVLERTEGIELDIIGNQLGCRVVELLLPTATAAALERYMRVVSDGLRKLCCDNFSSHVVECVLRVACERATAHMQHDTPARTHEEEHTRACEEFTMRVAKYVLNNLEEFVWQQYANHIVRAVLRCLSGVTLLPGEKPKVNMFKDPIPDKKGIPPHHMAIEYSITPDSYKQIVIEFSERLLLWPQLKDMPFQSITSGLLQVLLFAIKNCDKKMTKKLIRTLMNESFVVPQGDEQNEDKDEKATSDATPLANVFKCEYSVRLLEACLYVSDTKTYTQLYANCFINHLSQLSTMSMLNFTVQRLIDNVQQKEEFEAMYDELSVNLNGILVSGNTGVLVAIAKAALRLKAKQTQFVNQLENILKCVKEEGGGVREHDIVACLLTLCPSDKVDINKDMFVHIHGSVILQTLLHYQRPTHIVSAIVSTPVPRLVAMLSDCKGSHVADAFFEGPFVGVKAKDKFVWLLKGNYQQLSLKQYGSRVVETIFKNVSMVQKCRIMDELCEKSNLLQGTQYGRLVAHNLKVDLYKTSPEKWQSTLNAQDKNTQLFKNITDNK